MQQAILEPRPLYGIGTVARLTGLKPDTLRVWERRYGLGASHKSRTGRRQYTQSDLEHLQLVAALVSSGSRIGEIASSQRKTLEMLLRGRPAKAANAQPLPVAKPRAIFIGEGLCDWLDEHQGCLANVDAHLARFSLADSEQDIFENMEGIDCLVVQCVTLASAQLGKIQKLVDKLQPGKVIVCYQFCNERWLKEIETSDIRAVEFPPDPAYLAFEINNCAADAEVRQGQFNLGELVESKPRQYSEQELSAARRLQSTLDCECPKHITDLVRALANFEEYSASCSVENWRDASIHACIYAYTGQARWLMERALAAVLEGRTAEFSVELQKLQQAEAAA
jgi:DNA-binding transcriptional MerR regulator